MIKKGLVKVSKEKSDTRKRLMALSDKGKSLAAKLKPVWQAFEEATNELFRDTGFDVMLVISRLERELEKKDLFTRINEKVKHTLAKQVEIVPFRPEYRSAFKELNYEWLKKYFRVEEADRKILGDPEKSILKNGGYIYFGKIDEEILGTGALVNHGNHTYEIVKMAVTERAQGRQIGRKLAEKLISIAREKKAKRVILETSRKLETAIHLYRSLGFETVERGQSTRYERPTMSMELQL
jgi:ribosomal protein S18 acetylase RimI-like enzyme